MIRVYGKVVYFKMQSQGSGGGEEKGAKGRSSNRSCVLELLTGAQFHWNCVKWSTQIPKHGEFVCWLLFPMGH
jgi:hypothetical protein